VRGARREVDYADLDQSRNRNKEGRRKKEVGLRIEHLTVGHIGPMRSRHSD
jgi:hypothetical protein